MKTFEGTVDQEMMAAERLRLLLSVAQYFVKRTELTADHAFLVDYGGSPSHKDAWPDEDVPGKR